MKRLLSVFVLPFIFFACKKDNPQTPPVSNPFTFVSATVDDSTRSNLKYYGVSLSPVIKLSFSAPVNTATAASNISFYTGGSFVQNNITFSNGDSTIVVQPKTLLKALTTYTLVVSQNLRSQTDSAFHHI